MANLTLVIDNALLQQARIKALQQGTSVNEICRDAIAQFAAPADDADAFIAQWRALARRTVAVASGALRTEPEAEPLWPGRERLYAQVLGDRLHGLRGDQSQEPAPRKRR